MPLDRRHRLTDQNVVIEGPGDIDLVLSALERAPSRSFFTRNRAEHDVAEEIEYQLLVHPEWIAPHVDELVRRGVAAAMRFDWTCMLMSYASPALVAELIDRCTDDSADIGLLLASRTTEAMRAGSDLARRSDRVRRECRDLGFHLPEKGPLEPRFTIERFAAALRTGSAVADAAHAVGLPLADVVAPGEDRITFQYASVTPRDLAGMPAWLGRAHIVSVRSFTGWTLFVRAGDDARLTVMDVLFDDDRSLDELADQLDDAATTPQPTGALDMLSYNDGLTYANQHPLLTPGVFGVFGGPPIGLVRTPSCPGCGTLMFHVGWIDGPREYGDGFRSLFICETCQVSATLATLHN